MGEGSPHPTAIYCPSCGYDMAGLTRAGEVMCPECGRYLDKGDLVPRLMFPPLSRYVLRLALPHAIGAVAVVLAAGLCMLLPDDASLVAAAIVACYLPVAAAFMGMVDAISYHSLFARRRDEWRYSLTGTIVTILGSLVVLGVSILMASVLVA